MAKRRPPWWLPLVIAAVLAPIANGFYQYVSTHVQWRSNEAPQSCDRQGSGM